MSMDDLPILNEHGTMHTPGVDLQYRGIPSETLHLEHILQSDSPQHPAESLLGLKLGQLVQRRINGAPPSLVPRLLEEQFRPVAETGRTMMLGRIASENNLEHVGEFPLEQIQKLQTIHHGHMDIEN